jgi:hypothetical protein
MIQLRCRRCRAVVADSGAFIHSSILPPLLVSCNGDDLAGSCDGGDIRVHADSCKGSDLCNVATTDSCCVAPDDVATSNSCCVVLDDGSRGAIPCDDSCRANGSTPASIPPLSTTSVPSHQFAVVAPSTECASFFLDPFLWSQLESIPQDLEGRLFCPRSDCRTKLGSFCWSGSICVCGEWITPSFALHNSKVDAVNNVNK